MADILIRNARLVNEGHEFEGDLLVSHGRIEKIAGSIEGVRAAVEIDAAGQWLLPGMIDDQVHFREPGARHKGCIASESRAAVAGGITSFMDMPNTAPPTLTLEALADKKRRAAGSARANYGFHFGVSRDNLETIAALDPHEVAGVKVFMGASTGGMLVDDPQLLEQLFVCTPTILLAHCEHTPSILRNEARIRERYGEFIPPSAHPLIRDAEACYRSSSLAVDLARRFGTRLHVLHLTSARELSLFEPGPVTGKRITAEACIHHLLFDDGDYAGLGHLIKCNPAIKTRADRDALRQALLCDRIDVIGTDHAPHSLEEKRRTYAKAPSGLPLVQHALPALLELVEEGVMPLTRMVHKTSHAVADLFSIRERGYLREGYWADLALVERLAAPRRVDDEPVLAHCGWTPFQGRSFRHAVRTTLVSGQLAWHEGRLHDDCQGLPLSFDR
ncbi:dihydroorotase [Stutzerimonas nitrititolerans]|uniref:dihydroorotase n=1 Tax=Stutzerimonas nitrititolerans TaxID=2482751 RepID=UPI000EB8DFBC|nr:dihydroorotase [Stutzerimonas nitrititolerans]HCL78116.1 dihydroorotase [Pseudomonas sp.]